MRPDWSKQKVSREVESLDTRDEIMTQNKPKPYTRLIHVLGQENRILTDDEKNDIAEAILDNMTPYEIITELYPNTNIYEQIYLDFEDQEDIEIVREYVYAVNGYDTVDEYIETEGLPLPDRDDMEEYIAGEIDEEDYINETMEDIDDRAYHDIVYNLDDDEIVELFGKYVNDAIYEEEEE